MRNGTSALQRNRLLELISFAFLKYFGAMIKITHITYYISYVVGTIAFLFGIAIVCGVGFANVPQQIRIAFGIVLMLWGIYRLVLAWSNYRQQQKEDEE